MTLLDVEKRLERDPPERLARLTARMTPRLRRRFLAIVERVRKSIPLAQLARWIEAGRTDLAMGALDKIARMLAAEVGSAFTIAGQNTSKFLADTLGIVLDFDATNDLAVTAMRQNSLRIVREFTTQQREAVRLVLAVGVRDGLNPRETARRFRQSVGLTEKQMAAVENYRRLLQAGDRAALRRMLRDRRSDPAVERSVRTGEPLTAKQVDYMVERYRERYVKYRAETIAMTEALGAVHEGSEVAYRQAVESGDVDEAEVERTWNTAKDERVRGSHRTMHLQKRGLRQPFTSGKGNLLMRPGDPSAPAEEVIRCRCSVGVRLKPLPLG